MIKQIHIFDLDGTLVDSSHRYRTIYNGDKLTIDFPHWLENCKYFYKDSALPLAKDYKEMLSNPEIYTVWCTARAEPQVKESYDFLKNLLGLPNKFFYRPAGNIESGSILKSKQLKSFFSLNQFIDLPKFFYEDNKDYLATVCKAINATPIYIKSNQGH